MCLSRVHSCVSRLCVFFPYDFKLYIIMLCLESAMSLAGAQCITARTLPRVPTPVIKCSRYPTRLDIACASKESGGARNSVWHYHTQLCSRGHGHDVEATHDSVTCGLGRLRHVCVRCTTHMAQQGRGGLTAGGCTYTGCEVATGTLHTASAVLQGTPLLTGEGPHMWRHPR